MACVLHVGFRHQQDEFISPVAGHHVGAPAIRFEDMSDSLQNKVALKVTVKIVDEFEAVEVHQHQCKGASGAGGALPLVAQRFHEKAVRLNAGEAIGDGLLLRLLKGISIVQRPGDEVGEGADEQNFFVGKFDVGGGLDEKYSVKLLGIENRKGHRRSGVRQERLERGIRNIRATIESHLAIARNMSDEPRAKRYALT